MVPKCHQQGIVLCLSPANLTLLYSMKAIWTEGMWVRERGERPEKKSKHSCSQERFQ